MRIVKKYWFIVLTGLAVGAAAVILSACGNPANMGFCIACFLRDIAGATGLHGTEIVQYVRPEIIGLVLGSFIIALIKKEWRPTGGSSPMTRFLLAMIVMFGALIFLGCPLRMVIRIGGGDLNAVVGLLGFIAGILIGIVPLKLGFSLKRAYKQSKVEGLIFPVLMVILLIVSLVTGIFKSSESGPGSMRANPFLALGIAIIVGALCQRSRLCMVGGVRDATLFKDFKLLFGFIGVLVAVLVGNLIIRGGDFAFAFEGQHTAHADGIFNFLGMVLVGWGSVLLGGCPLRQLILAGEGSSDAAITVSGFIVGAGLVHNFGLASSGTGIGAGPVLPVLIGSFVVLILISVFNISKGEK